MHIRTQSLSLALFLFTGFLAGLQFQSYLFTIRFIFAMTYYFSICLHFLIIRAALNFRCVRDFIKASRFYRNLIFWEPRHHHAIIHLLRLFFFGRLANYATPISRGLLFLTGPQCRPEYYFRFQPIFSLLPGLKQLDPSTFGHQFGNLIDELPLKYSDLSRIIFELLFFDFIDFFRNWFQFQNLSDSPAYKNRPHELLEPVKHRQEQFIILPLLIATEFRLDQDCAMINEHKHGWLYLFVVFDKPQSIALMLPYLRKQEPGQSGQKTRSLIIRMATKVSSVRSGMGFCVVPIFK